MLRHARAISIRESPNGGMVQIGAWCFFFGEISDNLLSGVNHVVDLKLASSRLEPQTVYFI